MSISVSLVTLYTAINEWVERRRREWNEKDAKSLVKISSDNITAGRRSPEHPERS